MHASTRVHTLSKRNTNTMYLWAQAVRVFLCLLKLPFEESHQEEEKTLEILLETRKTSLL